jgi:ornithine cyclodeaminase/alanine dehydrogenase-like protein (mu-crystallin family)
MITTRSHFFCSAFCNSSATYFAGIAYVMPLGAVIAGEASPRLHGADTVVYRLEGGTVQDLFVATWGYQWARARGLGREFDLSS